MIGTIKYGDVQLEITRINDVRSDVVMSNDGVDRTCTQVTVDMNCIFSPSATSYFGVNGFLPSSGGDAHAGQTYRALFDYLSEPRRVLKMWTLNQSGQRVTFLESPATLNGRPLPSDFRHGPICKVFNIVETFGIKTYDIHLQFVTWVNNCYDGDSPIVSHRWETYIDYNEDHFQTTTRRGTTVFNVGRLFQANLSPDHFREQMFMPVARNFTRRHVNVQVASDCSQANWTTIDVEEPFNLGTGSPATRLEANLTTWVQHGSFGNALGEAAPQINNNLTPSWWELGVSLVPGVGPWAAAGMWGFRNSMNSGAAVLGAAAGQLPHYYASITVRAHGGRTSRRFDLGNLCFALAHTWLGRPTFFNLATNTEVILTQDVAGKFVELRLTMRWSDSILPRLAGIAGPVGSLGAIAGTVLSADSRANSFLSSFFCNPDGGPFSENEAAMENIPTLNLTQQAIGNRPINTGQGGAGQPVNLNTPYLNSRGPGDLEYILVAALHGQCEPPALPGRGQGFPPVVPSDGRFTVPTGTIPILPIS